MISYESKRIVLQALNEDDFSCWLTALNKAKSTYEPPEDKEASDSRGYEVGSLERRSSPSKTMSSRKAQEFEISNAYQEVEQLKLQLTQREVDRKRLHDSVKRMMQDRLTLHGEREQLHCSIIKNKEENEKLNITIDELNWKISELTTKLAEASKGDQALVNSDMTSNADSPQQLLKQVNQKIDLLYGDSILMQFISDQKLTKDQDSSRDALSKLECIIQAINSLKDSREGIGRELESKKQQNDELQSENAACKEKIALLEQKLVGDLALSDAEVQIIELRERIQTLKTEATGMKATQSQLQDENSSLEEKMNSVVTKSENYFNTIKRIGDIYTKLVDSALSKSSAEPALIKSLEELLEGLDQFKFLKNSFILIKSKFDGLSSSNSLEKLQSSVEQLMSEKKVALNTLAQLRAEKEESQRATQITMEQFGVIYEPLINLLFTNGLEEDSTESTTKLNLLAEQFVCLAPFSRVFSFLAENIKPELELLQQETAVLKSKERAQQRQHQATGEFNKQKSKKMLVDRAFDLFCDYIIDISEQKLTSSQKSQRLTQISATINKIENFEKFKEVITICSQRITALTKELNSTEAVSTEKAAIIKKELKRLRTSENALKEQQTSLEARHSQLTSQYEEASSHLLSLSNCMQKAEEATLLLSGLIKDTYQPRKSSQLCSPRLLVNEREERFERITRQLSHLHELSYIYFLFKRIIQGEDLTTTSKRNASRSSSSNRLVARSISPAMKPRPVSNKSQDSFFSTRGRDFNQESSQLNTEATTKSQKGEKSPSAFTTESTGLFRSMKSQAQHDNRVTKKHKVTLGQDLEPSSSRKTVNMAYVRSPQANTLLRDKSHPRDPSLNGSLSRSKVGFGKSPLRGTTPRASRTMKHTEF